MKKLFYALAFILIALSAFWNISAYAVPNADGKDWGDGSVQGDPFPGGGGSFGGSSGGGSWGNSDGFTGNGGSGGSGSSQPDICSFYGSHVTALRDDAAVVAQNQCRHKSGTDFVSWVGGSPPSSSNPKVGVNCTNDRNGGYVMSQCFPNPDPPPECPIDYHYDGSNCVKDLKCPQGYEKQGDKCVWQCPAGYKELGGSCVKDDQPEDCDPAIQQCDENGEPQCMCKTLRELVNLTNTQINNDNRVISLTETMTSNQNVTNNNLNNVNNNLNVINNNMSIVNNNIKNINESINNVINAIENNNPDFDTTALENKIDEVITAITNNTGGGGGSGEATDLTALLQKLDEMHQSIIDNKYDDTELKAKIDELINKDLSEITDRQDEQTSLLEDIKNLLMPVNEAGQPDVDLPEVETENSFDPWSAIRGFNINQNLINASSQCPADKQFEVMGASFAIPMTPMCTYLGYLAPVFLAIAYFQGAMIILRSGD